MKKQFLSWAAVAFTLLTLASCGSGTKTDGSNTSASADNTADKFKGKTLNILCWEGYADEAFTKAFADKYGCTVKGTYFGSSDELVSKLQSGGGAAYDLVSPSSDVASYLIEAGLVQPVDVKKITAFDSLSPLLRDMTDVRRGNDVYGVPFTWGPDYLVYNADKVKQEPKSWNVFFEPRYKGKVSLWDDISNLYLMGQIMGYDKADKSALYNMNDQQLAQVKKKLIALKPQIRKFWATAGELDQMMKNGEVWMAVGWPLTPATLNAQGMNIKAVIPQEGATGWIDRLMITKDAANKELAELYLDFITQPENMAGVAKVTNYSIANPGAARFMDKSLQDLTYVNNMGYYHERLNFWQYVKERKKYNEIWNEIKSEQM
jgi:putative spermidine/putrescine transport system substrate-binding protein/spermidine/putrescine transport system substrate-binding protein